MNNSAIIDESDRELKSVLSRYGVADEELAACTIEILLVMLKTFKHVEKQVKDELEN